MVARYGDGSPASKNRLRTLIALADVDDLATRKASTGALAMLASWEPAADAILEQERGVQTLLELCLDESEDVVHRAVVTLLSLVSAPEAAGRRGVQKVRERKGVEAMQDVMGRARQFQNKELEQAIQRVKLRFLQSAPCSSIQYDDCVLSNSHQVALSPEGSQRPFKKECFMMTRALDETTDTHPPAYSAEAPPPQDLPLDLSLRLEQLKLGPKPYQYPTVDECTAHLKLLEAIHQLREEIANGDGLFGISSPQSSGSEEGAQKLLRVCEKRWAVYVNRAVGRFARWYEACVPVTVGSGPCGGKLTQDVLTTQEGIQDIAEAGQPIAMLMAKDRMPPMDVLMVWHAYLLNPRCFFEDCFRYGKMDFYATGLPWSAIDQCIDKSLDYVPSDAARNYFETATGCQWNNIDDPSTKALDCANCGNTFSIPWTEGAEYTAKNEDFQTGHGYADGSFACSCPSCGVGFSHVFLLV
ncbi:hypothetical protein LTS18_007902 [Coniosporium uncinatum]|uniref:Uncharacterized protein n=1 Tax=Coniosporium uncinatum TaxID=93489 RepID=A0ACC3D2G3_9PEZI|nr:hypothetical protein LTS18_007902 [Coniosporium uncinatum]